MSATTQPNAISDRPVVEVVVVQATAFCNIACTYCYLPMRDDRAVMQDTTVRRIFERVFDSGYAAPELSILWHAGEPLSAGLEFYKRAFKAIEAIRPPNLRIIHSLQTNGTLLSDAWCDLIEQWDVRVGVSVDGPKPLHDARRVMRNGGGSFDRTMTGIRALQRRGIPFHALTVLSIESLQNPEALHDFYVGSGIDRVCFNVEESEGQHVSALMTDDTMTDVFRTFLETFWRLARRSGKVGFVREIDGMISRIVRTTAAIFRNPQVEPLAMLNVDRNGLVSTFSPELLGYKSAEFDDFVIGDVHRDTLQDMYASCLRSPMYGAIRQGVSNCQSQCGYFSVCGGGAPVNKLYEAGQFEATETGYCRLTQIVPATIVLDAIDRLELSELPSN